ncbi:DUF6711 family protein [Psychrobacillus lasiicapitis]|uniref:Uncharacterized protein n=1 Tax=Psychrobacillus lasiicapitis TaxID=1636719 RepID=A0A544TAD5_9BACI|nr:DUF6711 family protein [Psychrobacillus lasiicapitis]TQR14399.1 hypothetical protein FG382_08045 [Psychrobacillus lasiicapitis]GGA31682.1 hypothetical protein GCM10011384_21520 [Psychrobacillus lasiicapitis]
MIKIDGKEIPTPSDYSVGIQDISKAERNARGSMIIERIATKRKIELAWKHLSKQDLQSVLNAVSPVFFKVEYLDPQTNSRQLGTFYAGDRNVGALDYINGQIRWKDCKFNIVER